MTAQRELLSWETIIQDVGENPYAIGRPTCKQNLFFSRADTVKASKAMGISMNLTPARSQAAISSARVGREALLMSSPAQNF